MDTQTTTKQKTWAVSLDELPAHILEYEKVCEAHSKYNFELRDMRPPTPPDYVDALEELEYYLDKVQEYKARFQELEKLINVVYTSKVNESAIIKASLPLTNVWFRFVTTDGERWVGIQTSDWGGGETTIYIHKSKPDWKLRHQVTTN